MIFIYPIWIDYSHIFIADIIIMFDYGVLVQISIGTLHNVM